MKIDGTQDLEFGQAHVENPSLQVNKCLWCQQIIEIDKRRIHMREVHPGCMVPKAWTNFGPGY